MMDGVGLDTVAFIEENYIKERGLPSYPVEWLRTNYVSKSNVGAKSGNGGLYPSGYTTKKGSANQHEVAPPLNDKRLPSTAVVVPPPPRRKPSVVTQGQASECQNWQCGGDDGSRRSRWSSYLEPREPQRCLKRRRIVTCSMRIQ